MSKALLIIDVQNDYFPGGRFPLWNMEGTLENILAAIKKAKSHEIPIILVQHIATKAGAPFFNKDTWGANIYPRILESATNAPIVVKEFADSFLHTTLESILSSLGVCELLVCGMMTQNCVTHTAISKSSDGYKVSVLADCCTTVSEMIHNIALHAMSTRVQLLSHNQM